MASSFQDDVREESMRKLFDLYKDKSEGRSGIDAFLNLDNHMVPFELKTTSNGSVTTVRDFGLEHINKWQNKHWLIGFFIKDQVLYKYGSPAMMTEWIQGKYDYIANDLALKDLAPHKLNINDLYKILGKKSFYTLADAKNIQKHQYTKEQYLVLQDCEQGYTPQRMLTILQERLMYLIARGSTLNNPHIPFKYFDNWFDITQDHAKTLRNLVKQQLEKP